MEIGADIKHLPGSQRIFLIDRDMVNRSALYFMISADNEIHEFERIADAAETGGRLIPDLVIVNALLVAEHGKALIQGWRAVWPRVKVLLICEACDTECVTAARTAGAVDTLQRPFRRDEVRRKASRWADSINEIKAPLKLKDNLAHARH